MPVIATGSARSPSASATASTDSSSRRTPRASPNASRSCDAIATASTPCAPRWRERRIARSKRCPPSTRALLPSAHRRTLAATFGETRIDRILAQARAGEIGALERASDALCADHRRAHEELARRGEWGLDLDAQLKRAGKSIRTSQTDLDERTRWALRSTTNSSTSTPNAMRCSQHVVAHHRAAALVERAPAGVRARLRIPPSACDAIALARAAASPARRRRHDGAQSPSSAARTPARAPLRTRTARGLRAVRGAGERDAARFDRDSGVQQDRLHRRVPALARRACRRDRVRSHRRRRRLERRTRERLADVDGIRVHAQRARISASSARATPARRWRAASSCCSSTTTRASPPAGSKRSCAASTKRPTRASSARS